MGVIIKEFNSTCFKLPGYSFRPLTLLDESLVQGFLEECEDYAILEGGKSPQPGDGSAFIRDLPPGKQPADKFAFALENDSRVIAILDLVRGYPESGIWWIGLLLIHPDFRGKGLGNQVVQMFFDLLPQYGVKEIRLGVLQENQTGHNFWQRHGFSLCDTKHGRQFGKKTHTVLVMKKVLSS